MRFRSFLLAITALVISHLSANAADPAIKSLPDTPLVGKPFVVYGDGNADKMATWQAFYNGQKLADEDFEAQGSWLKVRTAKLGHYMFVLKSGDKQFAKAIDLPAATAATPQSTPQANQPATPPAPVGAVSKASNPGTTQAGRSPIDTAIYSSMRRSLVWPPLSTTDESVREKTQIAYAEALEQVARGAVQNKWATPRINQEAVDAIRRLGRVNDQLLVEELEILLKTVALRFTDKAVEESPADAILALVSLATVLRDNPVPGIRKAMQPPRSLEAPQLSEAPSMSVAAPCCQGGRFLRRR